ncbi:BTB/POZ domain-containing protein 7-like [Patiria miniata]|uniref:BTB domain-containing protein n=1 Tax=Patiria miniata TaxID=46514 RepID=A0A914BFG9_PATMI|nr:BTB/POZ domain-containing protein 7-like [Patiria miniata]XP_038074605.1 BTB/POZ domain-containing protein 7-like [Patiria miniata]
MMGSNPSSLDPQEGDRGGGTSGSETTSPLPPRAGPSASPPEFQRHGPSHSRQPSHHHLHPHGDETLELPSQPQPPAKHEKEKKKKTSLASLKKRIVRRKRTGKSLDHARAMREMASGWNHPDVYALVEEYDALAALKELTIQTDLARPSAASLKDDLLDLYDYKFCSDIDFIFRDTVFPVHRAVLSFRCPYFRKLMSQFPKYGAKVPVKLRLSGVSVSTFSALLRYLYSGDFIAQDSRLDSLDTLIQLGEKFGTPSPLEHDLRHLLETGEFTDAVLVFSSDLEPETSEVPTEAASAQPAPHKTSSLRCHKAVLAARSPFFRNLLQKRQRSGEDSTERTLQAPTKIVLDDSIIPKKYAQVLLYAIYQDVLDLSLVLPDSPSVGSLGEAQAMAAGKAPMSRVEMAMELYQIARFLDLGSMAQACEDTLANAISTENLSSILNWSAEPHGSRWVHRQAMHYLREEFSTISGSVVLFELSKALLKKAIKSDFLQASEAEVLKAVVKWGEHQLIRRMEDREPNLVSNTQHSVSRKGIKRRDMDNKELREIISDLLPLVRLDHIIPRSHETLTSAIKRGLIPTPPSHMLPGDELTPQHNLWIAGKRRRNNPRPRLFTPYVEEAKSILDEQMVSDIDSVRLRRIRMSYVPDALYMLEDRGECSSESNASRLQSCPPAGVTSAFPTLDEATVKAMLAREKDLHRCSTAQRAYSLRCVDSAALARQIHMRIVREYGLPDEATEIFASYPREYSEQAEVETDTEVFGRKWNEPPDLQLQNEPSEAPQVAATAQVVPILSEIMPDIAIPSGPDLTIATAPPINQMLLREPELGDSHSQAKGGSGSNKGGKPVKGNKHGPDQFTDV